MLKNIHKTFAFIAFSMIALFWSSTVIVELFFGYESIALVKSLIVLGLFILVPSIIATAITGNILAKSSKKEALIQIKRKRMPFIAIIGAVVLLPSAIYLNILASQGIFDSTFYTIQAIELLAGAINLTLMFLNIRQSKREK